MFLENPLLYNDFIRNRKFSLENVLLYLFIVLAKTFTLVLIKYKA